MFNLSRMVSPNGRRSVTGYRSQSTRQAARNFRAGRSTI